MIVRDAAIGRRNDDTYAAADDAREIRPTADQGDVIQEIIVRDAVPHGGSVGAESRGDGKGSMYTIKLPVMDTTSRRTGLTNPPIDAAASERLIMLVEDHDASRSALKAVLTNRNYRTIAAKSAEEALEIAAKRPIALVISDLWLPDKSGFEMMKLLRERYGMKGIAMSGFGSPEDRARSKAAGFQSHLTKPVDISALEAAMASLLLA